MGASSEETGMSGMSWAFQTHKTLMRKEALKSRKAEWELIARPVALAEPLALRGLLLSRALSEVSSCLAPPRADVGNRWLIQNSIFLWASLCHWAWARLTWGDLRELGLLSCLAYANFLTYWVTQIFVDLKKLCSSDFWHASLFGIGGVERGWVSLLLSSLLLFSISTRNSFHLEVLSSLE